MNINADDWSLSHVAVSGSEEVYIGGQLLRIIHAPVIFIQKLCASEYANGLNFFKLKFQLQDASIIFRFPFSSRGTVV